MRTSPIQGAGAWPTRLVLCIFALAAIPEEMARAQDRSPIVLNCDGNGTTIVKPFPGESSFQVQQLWSNNSVNGIQAFTDGSFAFVNCQPTLRTTEDVTLSCSIYDQALGRWGEPPIVTTVGLDFLDGTFANPYNSLSQWTGDYLTLFDIGSESYSFRLQFLDAVLTGAGFPVLLGETNPETRQTFLLRNVDQPDGTSKATNVAIGMQFGDLCADFDLNAFQPGGVLAGTFSARVRDADGTCGEVVVANRSAAFVPTGGDSGEAGSTCRYRVEEVGECTPGPAPYTVGSTLCLPCSGECREFREDIDIVFTNVFSNASAYIDCLDVVVEPAASECSRECADGLPAITILQSPGSSATAAVERLKQRGVR